MNPFINPVDHAISSVFKHLICGVACHPMSVLIRILTTLYWHHLTCACLFKFRAVLCYWHVPIAQHSAWCVLENMVLNGVGSNAIS